MKKEQEAQTVTLKLDIEYPARVLKAPRGEEPITPETVSFNVIYNAINDRYDGQQKRMDYATLRKWGRIDKAISDDDGKAVKEAKLSVEQHEWLLKTLKEAHYPPAFSQAAPLFIESMNGKSE